MDLTPHLIRGIIAPLWARHEGSPYLKIAQQLEKDQFMSLQERCARQWKRLKILIQHAWDESPFYRGRLSEVGFYPGDLKSWEDVRLLPILSKTDIREHGADILAKNAKKDLVPRMTSGSTGVSLNFYTSDSEFQFKRGVNLFRDQWTGWRLGEWTASLWGNPSHAVRLNERLRNILLERSFVLDTLKMDESRMHNFAAEILRHKPTLLFGHAHSLYLFANFWEKRGLPRYSFKGVLSTAMVLHEHERTKCQSVFCCPVFDRYGCEEVSLIASECEAHEGLHVNTDSLYVELIRNGGQALPGEEGKVVITDLRNFSMPFIRYEVGDMAVVSEKECSCGRSYPLLTKMAGRVADYLITPHGEFVSGISLTDHFATLIPGVEQVQIIQERIDLITLRLVAKEGVPEQCREKIAALVEERFGPGMSFQLELVKNIPLEASGKYRFSICKVNNEIPFNP